MASNELLEVELENETAGYTVVLNPEKKEYYWYMDIATGTVNMELVQEVWHDYYFALAVAPAIVVVIAFVLALACALLPFECGGSPQLVSDSHVDSCPLLSADESTGTEWAP